MVTSMEEEEEDLMMDLTAGHDLKHVPTSNFGQLGLIEKASCSEEEYALLSLQSEVDRWAETIASYQDFIRATKTLESKYVRLKPIRHRYRICSGVVVWVTLVALALGIQIAVPLGWDTVSKLAGCALIILSFELLFFSVVPMTVSCFIGQRKRVPNPVYFFPAQMEVTILSLLVLAMGSLFLMHGYKATSIGPAFGAFVVALALCSLTAARIILFNTPDPLIYLFLTALFALSISGYYLSLEGTFTGVHWWTSFLTPSVVLALFCLVCAAQLIRLAIKRHRQPSAAAGVSGLSFRHRFMQGVQNGPFFLTTSKVAVRKKPRTLPPVKRAQQSPSAQPTTAASRLDSVKSDGNISSPMLRQLTVKRTERYKKHLGLLEVFFEGHLLAAIGLLLIGVGVVYGGLFVSGHYHQILQQSIMDAATQGRALAVDQADNAAIPAAAEPTGVSAMMQEEYRTARKKKINKRKKRWMQPLNEGKTADDNPAGTSNLEIQKDTDVQHSVTENPVVRVHEQSVAGSGDSDLSILETANQIYGQELSLVNSQSSDGRGIPGDVKNNNGGPAFFEARAAEPNLTTSQHQSDKSRENQPGIKDGGAEQLVNEVILAEHVVGNGSSWWISVTTLTLGLILSTRLMVNVFGSWLEDLAFSFLDTTNRNAMIDLNYPDHDIKSDPELLSPGVQEKAKIVLKRLDEIAFDIFMKPKFEGCVVKIEE